jgi:hypothetical protein
MVLTTKGPYLATGSFNGFPAKRRNLHPSSSSTSTSTLDPGSHGYVSSQEFRQTSFIVKNHQLIHTSLQLIRTKFSASPININTSIHSPKKSIFSSEWNYNGSRWNFMCEFRIFLGMEVKILYWNFSIYYGLHSKCFT